MYIHILVYMFFSIDMLLQTCSCYRDTTGEQLFGPSACWTNSLPTWVKKNISHPCISLFVFLSWRVDLRQTHTHTFLDRSTSSIFRHNQPTELHQPINKKTGAINQVCFGLMGVSSFLCRQTCLLLHHLGFAKKTRLLWEYDYRWFKGNCLGEISSDIWQTIEGCEHKYTTVAFS